MVSLPLRAELTLYQVPYQKKKSNAADSLALISTTVLININLTLNDFLFYVNRK